MLNNPYVDRDLLRECSWNGIPDKYRATSWKILIGYITGNKQREISLQKKRAEYHEKVSHLFKETSLDQKVYHQICIDVPRTFAEVPLFQYERVQTCLKKILYCWADRHPASSYVQGINDLVTPFFVVFLSSFIEEPENCPEKEILDEWLYEIEADCYWCLTKLIDGVQDNYTDKQPGIIRQLDKLKYLIRRIDAPLYIHLENENVDFIQIAFRWINCFLMRELSLRNIIRMWDTYFSQADGFNDFHVYVCASFLTKWSPKIQNSEFQDIILFLQNPPTHNWNTKEIEVMLSEAYMWKSIFNESINV